jgi:hypothetical protein
LIISNLCYSQSPLAAKWVIGISGVFANFDSTNAFAFRHCLIPTYFKQGNSNICDSNGNILLFSDGFNIYKYGGQYLDGGDTLVPHDYYVDQNGWSAGSQTSIFLPMQNSKYYFVTPTASNNRFAECVASVNCFHDLMLYNVIDMQANGGQGAVTKRMVELTTTNDYSRTQMMACRHANGQDWWLLKQGGDSNKVYKFLFTQDSVYNMGMQKFDAPVCGQWDLKGQSAFSLDGSMYATGTQGPYTGEFFLADFNRCTGELSNGRSLFAPLVKDNSPTDSSWYDVVLSGICFSPNKRFIYVTFQYNIFQYDLWDSTWYHVARHDTSWQQFQLYTTAYLANDNKIYIGNFGGLSQQISRIDSPDNKGAACSFCPRCLRADTVYYGYLGTPPCMPNYALGMDTSLCPPLLIENGSAAAEEIESEVLVYPNPAINSLTIQVPEHLANNAIVITNITGQIVRRLPPATHTIVDVSLYAKGIYFVSAGISVKKVLIE